MFLFVVRTVPLEVKKQSECRLSTPTHDNTLTKSSTCSLSCKFLLLAPLLSHTEVRPSLFSPLSLAYNTNNYLHDHLPANDVANAIGPYSVIYQVWSTGAPSPAKAAVPLWILAFGGVFIVIGLATYGYNIIKVLGNKITLVSPSRGTSMELGASITVIIASIYGIPVSTTMSITGATLGVALCNGTLSATNWRALAWILLGWIITVPIVGTAAGCLMSIILYAPRF